MGTEEKLSREFDAESGYILHDEYLDRDVQTTLDPLMAREIADETVRELEASLRQDVVAGRVYDQLNQVYNLTERPEDIEEIVEDSTFDGEIDYRDLAESLESELPYEHVPGEEILDIVRDESVENIVRGAYVTGSSNYGMTLAPDTLIHQKFNDSDNHFTASDIDLTVLISDVEPNYIDDAFEYFYEEKDEVQGELNDHDRIEVQPAIVREKDLLSGIKNGKRDFRAGKVLQYIALPIVDGENFEMQRTYPELMADYWGGISPVNGFRSQEFESEVLEGIDIVTDEEGNLAPGMYDRIIEYLEKKHGEKENSRIKALEENFELGIASAAKRNWDSLDAGKHDEYSISFRKILKDVIRQSEIEIKDYMEGSFRDFSVKDQPQKTLGETVEDTDLPEPESTPGKEIASRALERAVDEHPDVDIVEIDGEKFYETKGVRSRVSGFEPEDVFAGALRETYGRMISEILDRHSIGEEKFEYMAERDMERVEEIGELLDRVEDLETRKDQLEIDDF